MQSSFDTNISLYAYSMDYIRRLRDSPNSLDGVRFAGYSDHPNDDYVANIQKYFIEKRFRNEFPKEIVDACRVGGKYLHTKELNIKDYNTKYFSATCKSNNHYDYSKECAWAIAYICYGKRGELVNKENYLLKVYRAIYDFEKTYNKKLSLVDRSIVLHNTNKFLGLESYIFFSGEKCYVLMESEIKNDMGLKEKSYVVANMGSCSNVIFEADGSVRDEVRLVSQIYITPEEAQSFVDGELKTLINFKSYEIEEADKFIYGKFESLNKDDLPRIQYEDINNRSTPDTFANDYCFSVTSPVKVMTR